MRKLLLALLTPLFLYAQVSMGLSEDERAWLKSQKEITIGAMDGWAPFNFKNYKGEASGIGAGIVELLNTKMDGKLKIVSGSWNMIYTKAQSGELHAIMDITPKPEREEYFAFTRSYLHVPHVIVSRKNVPKFPDLKAIEGKKVALEKDIGTIAHLQKNHPEIIIQTYENTSLCLDALSRGEVDAYVGNRAVVNYTMAQELLENLKIDALDTSRKGSPLSIGISKKYPYLQTILQKAMDEISPEEFNRIFAKWSKEQMVDIGLNAEEKGYLRSKKRLRFVAGLEAWAPFSFVDKNDVHSGLEIDFVKLLESRLRVPIEITYMPWVKAVQSAKAHQFDGILSASPTPERRKSLTFSNAYYISPLALVTQQSYPSIDKAESFSGKRIALIEGSAFDEYVKQTFPKASFVYSKNETQGTLEMVLKGEADAAIDNLAPMRYILENQHLDDKLKVELVLYSEDLSSFQYGLRKDEPLLLSSINKAIASYKTDEKKEIKERWEGLLLSPQDIKSQKHIPSLKLTPEELAWIKEHPSISVANEPDWPPFDFTKEGKPAGLGIDYMNLVASKVGLHVTYVQAPWEELLERFKLRNIDVLHSMYKTPEREAYTLFTEPFYTSYNAMATRKGSNIVTLKDLAGKRVALLKEYGTSETLRQLISNIQPVEVQNLYEGLKAVSFGEADAVIDSIGTMSYVVMEQMLTNLSIQKIDFLDEQSGQLHFGTTKDKAILHSILGKGLKALSAEEHMGIRSRWVLQVGAAQPTVASKIDRLNLTVQEKEWLKANPKIRFTGDPNYLPYEAFKADGTYIGMMAEHLKIIEDVLGITFEKISSRTWKDALEKAKEGAVDVFSNYVNDPMFKETHISVPTDIKSPIVIVSKKNKRDHFIAELSQLKNDKIAVVDSYSYVNEIYEQYPHLHYVKVPNATVGLEGVASGQYDAMLCSLSLAAYKISELGLNNLQIVGKTDFVMHLGLSVKKEWEIFATILQKVIEQHSHNEHRNILNQWESLTKEQGVNYTLFLEILALILSIVAALFYWNYQLKKQVSKKTVELEMLIKAFDTHVIASKTDLKGNITYVSNAFCAISGSTREELLGKNHHVSRHPDNDPKVYEEMWKTITNGGIWQGRIKNRKKDGGYYWVDSVVQQDYDTNGNVIGYTSIRHDVTAQVELQELSSKLENIIHERTQELALLNEEQQAIFDSTSVGIALLKNRVIMQCNRRLDEIFGYETNEQLWESANIWYPQLPELSDRYETMWLGETATWEQELIRKDGTLFWARLSGRAINIHEHDKGVVAVVEDISRERQALEEIKRAKMLAEEATKIKSDFLANMSHEIRTPMNAIIGMSHLALQTDLSTKQRNYIDKINSASKNLLGIINDILDFSKIEAGKMTFETIDFYLEDVMEHLADLSVMKAQEKGLELLFDVGYDVPTALRGDPLRLGQVLINLVNNAIKFTATGEIKMGIHLLSTVEDKVELRFDVSDTGIGMSQEHQDKLFQAFSQADESTTRKYGGSGLGLAICKHLVERMDGSISVQSTMGKGSTFSFNATFELQPQQKRLILDDEDVQGLRILVVDDNESAREILESILRSLKFDVTSVSDGFKAIQYLQTAHDEAKPYGLVLMDWMMPGMDGVETIRKMRQHIHLSSTIAFIMITAYSKEELKAQLENIKVDGILIKPVSPSTLLNTILNVLGKEIVQHGRKEDKKILYQEALALLRGARILLVEDNVVNQEMAIEILEEAGLHVEIANDGLEALSKVMKGSYDGVLMDCQMPVMDGFEATKAIRQHEQFASLPILAMTANAMMGDKEKCLASGMNDHIAKPIDVAQLFLTMAKWITPREKSSSEAISPMIPETSPSLLLELPGVDLREALRRVGGNAKLLEKLLLRFSQTQAEAITRIKAALEANDANTAVREAHTLKGLSGNIGATTLFKKAQEIEHMIAREEFEHLDAMLMVIESELSSLISTISQALETKNESPLASRKKGVVDKRALFEKLETLKILLVQLDSEASEVIEEVMPLLGDLGYESEAEELFKKVNNFDFEAASAHLEMLMKRLKEGFDAES